MKILYFHQHFTTPKGAGGIRSYAMARKLIERGHSVTMVCGSSDRGSTNLKGEFWKGRREGVVDGIHVIELNLPYSNSDNFLRRTKLFIQFALRSIGLALTQQYDLLFATSTPLTAGLPGVFARWLRGKTFVFEVRDLWPELPRKMGVIKNPVVLKMMALLEWACYHSANRLIGLSPGIVAGIARRGVQQENITMIPNGCDLQLFTADSNQPWRPAEVQPADLMAVFTGAHGMANGLDAVLDAAAVLKQRGRDDIKIVLIGQGKLKFSLQRRAEKERLSNVIFHDSVPKERLAGLLASADIGLQILANVPAFYHGTSPNKFFDYIAASLPVLNNYPGWLADMINKYNFGFAVPPNNAEAFADALEKGAADRVLLKKQSRNARHLAERNFDRDKLAEHFSIWLEAAVAR